FSSPGAAVALTELPAAAYTVPVPIGSYVTNMRTFLGDPTALANGVAYSNRAVGNLARPFFPDGIAGTPNGPLSVPSPNWSPFNVGLQLDLVANAVRGSLGGDNSRGCTGNAAIANGIQIFPGSV